MKTVLEKKRKKKKRKFVNKENKDFRNKNGFGEEKKKEKEKRESGRNMSDLSIGHSHLIMCDDTLLCLSCVGTPYYVITIMPTDNDDLWLSHVIRYNPWTMTIRPSVNYILPA